MIAIRACACRSQFRERVAAAGSAEGSDHGHG